MGDIIFPAIFKPIVNRGYSFQRGSNVVQNAVRGGLAGAALDRRFEAVLFNVNLVLTRLGHQAFWDFYDGGINHGADSFSWELDSGNGMETHQCLITSRVQSNTNDQQTWTVSMEVTAERNPSQD